MCNCKILVLILSVYGISCNYSGNRGQAAEPATASLGLEKDTAIRVAEKIAFNEYGNIIKDELPLQARLVQDTIWIIQETLPKGMDGGTVYIELSKAGYKLLKITHYK